MLKFLILFFIFFSLNAEVKYQVRSSEKVDFDDPVHFEDSKYILDQIQKAEKIKKEKLELENAKKTENELLKNNFNEVEKEKNILNKSLIDPFQEINNKEEDKTPENFQLNERKENYDIKEIVNEKKDEKDLLKKDKSTVLMKENDNNIISYINILANRTNKKQNPLSKKAVEKKIIAYIKNQDFSNTENMGFIAKGEFEKKIIAKEDRFILTKPVFRTSNIVNAKQIIENEKYITKSADKKDDLVFKENNIEEKNDKKENEKNFIKKIEENAKVSLGVNNKNEKKNISNERMPVKPYIKKDFPKKQILPPNLLEIKNYPIETYKDLYSIAFDAIGKNNSDQILREVFSYLPFDNNELKDENGNNLLIYATLLSDYKAIDALIKYGINPNDKNNEGNSALHVATSYGNQEAIALMTLSNINPNDKNNDGNTPLMFAAAFGNMNILQIMLENGGNLYIENKDGLNSVDIAEMNGNIDLINQISLKYKSNIKSEDNIELLDKINN